MWCQRMELWDWLYKTMFFSECWLNMWCPQMDMYSRGTTSHDECQSLSLSPIQLTLEIPPDQFLFLPSKRSLHFLAAQLWHLMPTKLFNSVNRLHYIGWRRHNNVNYRLNPSWFWIYFLLYDSRELYLIPNHSKTCIMQTVRLKDSFPLKEVPWSKFHFTELLVERKPFNVDGTHWVINDLIKINSFFSWKFCTALECPYQAVPMLHSLCNWRGL